MSSVSYAYEAYMNDVVNMLQTPLELAGGSRRVSATAQYYDAGANGSGQLTSPQQISTPATAPPAHNTGKLEQETPVQQITTAPRPSRMQTWVPALALLTVGYFLYKR